MRLITALTTERCEGAAGGEGVVEKVRRGDHSLAPGLLCACRWKHAHGIGQQSTGSVRGSCEDQTVVHVQTYMYHCLVQGETEKQSATSHVNETYLDPGSIQCGRKEGVEGV